MRHGWSLLPVVLAIAFLASQIHITQASADEPRYGDIIGPVTATSMGIRLPTTAAEAARLTAADRARVEAALYARLPEWNALVDAGLVQLKRVSAPVQSASARGSVLAKPLAISAWGQCRIEWQDVFGGSWMRGYALTRADTTMYFLQVQVQLDRDGSTAAGPSTNNGFQISNVEQPTSWVWKGALEHYSWTTSSYHTAESNDFVYYLDNTPCNISMSY